MNRLADDELQARHAALRDGPWMKKGQLALNEMAPSTAFWNAVPAGTQIDLTSLALDAPDAKLAKSLVRPLRWHGVGGISEQQQIRLRDSLDDALTYLQLVELAVETGYIPAAQMPEEAKHYLLRLLWSAPAREYIRIYGYTTVEHLAARFNIYGVGRSDPPPADEKGAIVFSAFLATLNEIESSEDAQAWLGFLDDYVQTAGEQNEFYGFLRKGGEPPARRFASLLAGAAFATLALSDFFRIAPAPSMRSYCFFYAYWLAKMHGFTVGTRGYVRDSNWATGSWMAALAGYFERRAREDEAAKPQAKAFREATGVLADAWKTIRAESAPRELARPKAYRERLYRMLVKPKKNRDYEA